MGSWEGDIHRWGPWGGGAVLSPAQDLKDLQGGCVGS